MQLGVPFLLQSPLHTAARQSLSTCDMQVKQQCKHTTMGCASFVGGFVTSAGAGCTSSCGVPDDSRQRSAGTWYGSLHALQRALSK